MGLYAAYILENGTETEQQSAYWRIHCAWPWSFYVRKRIKNPTGIDSVVMFGDGASMDKSFSEVAEMITKIAELNKFETLPLSYFNKDRHEARINRFSTVDLSLK